MPRLLDLFCGAGGAAMGYHRAGFDEIVGVDNRPQPRYPFTFEQEDAFVYLVLHGVEFDVIHASPPCQRWAAGGNARREQYPELIAPLRVFLRKFGVPFVIENVVSAPLHDPVWVCGGALKCATRRLQLHRHRGFESNRMLRGTPCKSIRSVTCSVTGTGTPTGTWLQVGSVSTAERRRLMGIDWMTGKELSQAVPPAYTEYIGRQLLETRP